MSCIFITNTPSSSFTLHSEAVGRLLIHYHPQALVVLRQVVLPRQRVQATVVDERREEPSSNEEQERGSCIALMRYLQIRQPAYTPLAAFLSVFAYDLMLLCADL